VSKRLISRRLGIEKREGVKEGGRDEKREEKIKRKKRKLLTHLSPDAQ